MMTFSFWWRFLLCLGLGHWLLGWLANRATDDRRLRHVVLASFWLRAGLGVMLYVISSYHWPILRALHVQDGFWTFALDARLYHTVGAEIAEAWTYGIELPDPGMKPDYVTIIAAVYRLLGPHPLYAVLLHGWLGALTGWLAYRIGERLFDRRIALRAAVLVGFWPSSLLWSSQILRDVLSWCLILTILWLVALLVGQDARPVRVRWWRSALQAVVLAGATILLTRLRMYLGSILVLTALVTLVPAGCASLMNRRVGQAVRRFARMIVRPVGRAVGLGSVAAMMIGAVLIARDLDTIRLARLISPAHPERGHVRLGLRYQSAGDLARAEAEFRRAIELRPDYQQAYLVWAEMLLRAGRLREPLEIAASWPGFERDDTMRRLVDRVEVLLGGEGLVRQPEPMSMTRVGEVLVTLPEPAPPPSEDAPVAIAETVQATPVSEPASQEAPAAGPPEAQELAADSVTTPPVAAVPAAPITATRHFLNQGLALVGEVTPQWLGSLRSSVIVAGGGYALMDTQTDISQPRNLMKYLPRALLIGLLAPFPWQWFDTSGSTGEMRVFAGVEMALVYVLLIGLALRAWRAIRFFGLIGCVRLAIRRTQLGGVFLLVYGLAVAASASLVMANLGTLFRLRLLFWLPLLILVAAADPLGSYGWYRRLVRWMDRWYRRLVRWMARWRGGPPVPAGEPVPAGVETAETTSPARVAGARGGRSG